MAEFWGDASVHTWNRSSYTPHPAPDMRNGFTYLVLILGAFMAVHTFHVDDLDLGHVVAGCTGVRFLPTSSIHLENYVNAWEEAQFAEYMINSAQITIITLAGRTHLQRPGRLWLCPNPVPRSGSNLRDHAEHDDDPGHGADHPQFPYGHLAGTNRTDPLDK